MSDAPRPSRRVPRFAATDELFAPFDPPLNEEILHALKVTVHVQNLRKVPDVGPKSRYLSRLAADLELAIIEKRPKELVERLCLDVAATALRLLEQGDGKP
jgi:hypothetical protein